MVEAKFDFTAISHRRFWSLWSPVLTSTMLPPFSFPHHFQRISTVWSLQSQYSTLDVPEGILAFRFQLCQHCNKEGLV